MSEIRFYIEGDPDLSEGLAAFLGEVRSAARASRIEWKMVLCGGKDEAIKRFRTAWAAQVPERWSVLLVDSDCPGDGRLFACLSGRLDAACEGSVFWMVQVMEAWFLADRNALKQFYGNGFRASALPGNPKVEDVPKDDVMSGLKRATAECHPKKQHCPRNKVPHANQLLRRLDPSVVRQAAPNCDRLFTTLLGRIQASPEQS